MFRITGMLPLFVKSQYEGKLCRFMEITYNLIELYTLLNGALSPIGVLYFTHCILGNFSCFFVVC